MWIFTSDCFLSIVADKDNLKGDRLLVRSRVKGAINKLFPDVQEVYMTGSDYAYRAWVKRNEVSRVVQNYINALSYDNFKNSIKDKEYCRASMGVWQEMFDYQNREEDRLNPPEYELEGAGDNFVPYQPKSRTFGQRGVLFNERYGQNHKLGRKQ